MNNKSEIACITKYCPHHNTDCIDNCEYNKPSFDRFCKVYTSIRLVGKPKDNIDRNIYMRMQTLNDILTRMRNKAKKILK